MSFIDELDELKDILGLLKQLFGGNFQATPESVQIVFLIVVCFNSLVPILENAITCLLKFMASLVHCDHYCGPRSGRPNPRS
jgi:hypothetical protein